MSLLTDFFGMPGLLSGGSGVPLPNFNTLDTPAGMTNAGVPTNANNWPLAQTPSGWMPMGGPQGPYTVTQSEGGVPIQQTMLDVGLGQNYNISAGDYARIFPGQTDPYGTAGTAIPASSQTTPITPPNTWTPASATAPAAAAPQAPSTPQASSPASGNSSFFGLSNSTSPNGAQLYNLFGAGGAGSGQTSQSSWDELFGSAA